MEEAAGIALGRDEDSRASFAHALELGESESIRRPLLDAGPPLRALLVEHLRHSASHRWFASDLLSALNGSEGNYGIKPTADRLLPRLPQPSVFTAGGLP